MKEKRRGEYLVHIFYVQSSLCAFSYPFLTTALQGNSIFLYFTNKEGGLHLVKCVGPQPSVGAEIHTWGRVALMLCCLALGGVCTCGSANPKQSLPGCFLGGVHADSRALWRFPRTVSIGEHSPWFSKFNLAWNSLLPLKNPMSHFLTWGSIFVAKWEVSDFSRTKPLSATHRI